MSLPWRCAKALDTLLHELNATYPTRDKGADGAIGDAAHAATRSDHNPMPDPLDRGGPGVVRARDFDKDGIPAPELAERLRLLGVAGDPRMGPGAYVIWDHRIAVADSGWRWETYSGQSPHTDHIHLSICRDPAHYDSTDDWGITGPTHQEDDVTPEQAQQLTHIENMAGGLAWLFYGPDAAQGEMVKRIRDLSGMAGALVARDPAAFAAQVPADLAQQVADALLARIAAAAGA